MMMHDSRTLAHRGKRAKGLTLVEVIIAMFLCAIVLAGAMAGLMQGMDIARYSQRVTDATTIANIAMVALRSEPTQDLPDIDAADASIVYDATGVMLTPDGGTWEAFGSTLSAALTAQTVQDREDFYLLIRIEEDTVNTGLFEAEIEVLWSRDEAVSFSTAANVLANYDSLSKRGVTTTLSYGGFNGSRF